MRLPGVITAFRPEAVLLLEGYNDLGAVRHVGHPDAAASRIDTMAKEIRDAARACFCDAAAAGPRRG